MTDKFSNVPWNAPLFRGASLKDLSHIISLLDKASFHYADDSASEWSLAHEAKRMAAQKANELRLDYDAVEKLVKHRPQLVTVGDVINSMLKELRK